MARNGRETSNTTLQLKLGEFEGPRLLVLLNSEEVLLDTMYEDDIYTLTAEELCEENLDGLAIVIHGTLLHDSI